MTRRNPTSHFIIAVITFACALSIIFVAREKDLLNALQETAVPEKGLQVVDPAKESPRETPKISIDASKSGSQETAASEKGSQVVDPAKESPRETPKISIDASKSGSQETAASEKGSQVVDPAKESPIETPKISTDASKSGSQETAASEKGSQVVDPAKESPRETPKIPTDASKSVSQELILQKTPIGSIENFKIGSKIHVPSRFWTCHRNVDDREQKDRKLFFVHVFKTAGTTFRQFFRNYAHICNRRIITIRCTGVLSESLANQTSVWMLKGSDSAVRGMGYNAGPCIPYDFVDGESNILERQSITSIEEIQAYNVRQKTRLFEEVSYSKLREYDIDIISGHTPIGLHSNWFSEDEKVVTPLYITFFRDPIDRYVSSHLQKNKEMVQQGREKSWDFEGALAFIRNSIQKKRKDSLDPYLMTSAQKVGIKNMTEARRTNLMKSNLAELPVVIGVVEQMKDSLNLIRHAINSDKNALVENMIADLDIHRQSKRRLLEMNKSKLSTSALVREIKKDSDLFSKLKNLLRYEYEVYDYALELHKQQVKRLSEVVESMP